jgi:ATP-dependent RNA helicase DeaD
MQNLVEQYRNEHDVPALDIAAALAKLSIGDKPLLLAPDKAQKARRFEDKAAPRKGRRDRVMPEVDSDKRRYRIEVGHEHGVKPGNIVGAIANEAGLDGEHIGHIEIDQTFSLVDLPAGMPRDIFMDLKKVRVCGRPMKITMLGEHEKPPAGNRKHGKPKTKAKTKPKAKAKAKAKKSLRS